MLVPVNQGCAWDFQSKPVAAGALAIMVLLILVNVIGRYVFKKPFMGTVEIVQILLIITVFFSVAHTSVRDAHITFDEVVTRFTKRAQSVLMGIVSFVSAAYFLLMGWRDFVLSEKYFHPVVSGTDVLHIPIFPFIMIIAIGAIVLGVEMLLRGLFFIAPRDAQKKKEVK